MTVITVLDRSVAVPGVRGPVVVVGQGLELFFSQHFRKDCGRIAARQRPVA
jgi:hypothetical protein